MSNNTTKSLKLLVGSALILALSACGTVPPKPTERSVQQDASAKAQPEAEQKAEPEKVLTFEDHQRLRNLAASQGNWSDYLIHSQAVWQLSEAPKQAQIEEQAWTIVNSLSAYERDKLANSSYADVQAWFALYDFLNGTDRNNASALMNLQTFDQDAIFNAHLLPKLLAEQPEVGRIEQIAVLLPMQGKYKVISEQIRSGIVKAFYASDQKTQIKFYDSSDINELENVYTQAKQDGADRIIGPLRKEAVQLLASFHDESMLALNSLENATIPQFNFISSDPAIQMRNRFAKLGFKRIGIMTNDKPRNIADAKTLQSLWQQDSENRAEISIYPDERPKLRDGLGALIHENSSKERQNNVRWTVNEKLEFFPRTRKDLDAIVIIDSTQRMAVFRPQFDFFGLNVPLYSDSKLTPTNFQQQKPNRDLRDVRFLSYPAVLEPADLLNKFEAFGWDSFLVTTHFPQLQNGACLMNGKTGILSMQGPEVQQHQVWVTFNRQGMLEEAPAITLSKIEENTSEEE